MDLDEKTKQLIQEYLSQMSDREKRTMEIAQNHLKTSFHLLKSNGFKEWKAKNK